MASNDSIPLAPCGSGRRVRSWRVRAVIPRSWVWRLMDREACLYWLIGWISWVDTVQVLPPLEPWIVGFHQGAIIPSLPQGPSNTPTCIVVWENRSGTAVAERVDALGNRVWAAPVTVAQGNIVFTEGWPAAVPTTTGGGLVLMCFKEATNWELRVVGITEAGALMGPMNGSVITSNAVNQVPGIPGKFEAVAASGGACVFWQEIVDYAPIPTWTVWARRVDPSGVPVGASFMVASPVLTWSHWFPYGMIDLSHAVEDGAGGFFVAHMTAQSELKLAHFAAGNTAAATGTVATLPLSTQEFYSISSDGQDGVLVAWYTGQTHPVINLSLFVGRFNAQCVNQWPASANPITSFLDDFVPPALVPTVSGGAIVMYTTPIVENGAILGPRVFAQCLDSQGIRMGPVTDVSPPIGGQRLPVAIQCAPSTAGLVFRTWDAGLKAQRIGCCGRGPRSDDRIIPYPPRLFCEIPVDLPTVHYGGFMLNLPCGDRNTTWGVLPLDQLSQIPGIAAPGFLSSPDAPRPDRVEILLLGLPERITVTLRDTAGKLVAGSESVSSRGHARIVKFQPQPKLNYVLLFESSVRHDESPFVSVHVRMA
jgi:hypothetical protein